ncbi:ParB/RepB/Spo0J family partition protein [Eubacterium aggregans]|uniref:Chromosome partitioning protein, ParB family n=1 Tax=Eubacterium aggregans TaxID=81409 RepID=A0A1H3X2J8_9FIRM|nr:ParB/RepB/Spo0J family partition protein [Eubacterium aggregans]MDD4691364.1 ParB/RepB/Spo0J family partition protein [Eubacterium aggregans]SDZ93201.1 chromosome partitioning protein, ParB family [Eubacterium aggregans]
MAKAKGLGKGLKALISEEINFDEEVAKVEEKEPLIFELEINKIRPNSDQPRKNFARIALEELAASIAEHGILQPLVVKPEGKGYTIVAGERRFRAASIAGLKVVPVIIRDLSAKDVMEIALIENVQREDLNAIEEAMAYGKLMDAYNLTQGEIGIRIGKSRATVANTMRLLNLPKELQNQVLDEKISSGHARALLALEEPGQMIALGKEIEEKHLSVREVEKRVKAIKNPRKEKELPSANPFLVDLEDQLTHRYATAVHIKGTDQKGKIELEYFSTEELNRLLELMNITGRDYETRKLS